MKRWLYFAITLLFITGCSSTTAPVREGLALRQRILDSNGCEFDAVIMANYTDCSYTFTLHCITNDVGDLDFTVQDPETIHGIKGRISSAGGDLRFEDAVLAFDTLADGLLSPVSTPWLCMKVLRSGYLHSVEKHKDSVTLTIDDTYRSENVRALVQLNKDSHPEFCEIFWQGKRYLSMDVRNFVYL